MTTADSTATVRLRKPYPDFPLTPRGDGRWCKRIRGKLFYFRGFDQALINKPLRYGQGFRVVDKRILRQHRNNTDRTFTVDQIRCVLASAGDTIRAVTLLGINNAFGLKILYRSAGRTYGALRLYFHGRKRVSNDGRFCGQPRWKP